MIEQLAPVIAVPAVITAAWVAAGLRLAGSRLWLSGAFVGAVIASLLMLIAAFLPLIGALGSLGVPALCVGGGIALMFMFSTPMAVAAALSVPFAFLVLVQPPFFPLLMPLILVIPLWTVGWIERKGDVARYALSLLAVFIAVPVAVLSVAFLLRGS